MPETNSNGAVTSAASATDSTVVAEKPPIDLDRYRPEASTTEVHDEMLRSLTSVVVVAAHNAIQFVQLADLYDRDAGTAVRYGHVVDATECLEIAMTYLGQLKAAMNHRLRLEDAQHGGESPY